MVSKKSFKGITQKLVGVITVNNERIEELRISFGPRLPNRSASSKVAASIPSPSSKMISCGSSDGSSKTLS